MPAATRGIQARAPSVTRYSTTLCGNDYVRGCVIAGQSNNRLLRGTLDFNENIATRLGAGSLKQVLVIGSKGTVSLQDVEIIHLLWEPHVRIEAPDARAAMAAVNAIAQGAEYPLLVDMTSTRSLSRQARAVFTTPCAATRIALLGTSPVDRILANWSLGVQNLPCPTRFFTAEPEAIRWLLSPRDSGSVHD